MIFLGVIAFLHFLLPCIKAKETCNPFEPEEFFCYDTHSKIAFCCDYYNFDYHSCCYADEVWTLWYFWIGIICGIIFLAAIFVMACRCLKKPQQPSANPEHLATITQTTVQQECVPISEIDQNVQIKLAGAPPSYEKSMSQPGPGQPYPVSYELTQAQVSYFHPSQQQQPYYPPPTTIQPYGNTSLVITNPESSNT